MADPTPLARTTELTRLTVADIKLFVARALGIDSADFTADEDTLLLDFINREVNEWRHLVQNTKPMGQEDITYEWAGGGGTDPGTGDSSVELPASFAELEDDHVWVVDTDSGEPTTRIPVISRNTFQETFFEGENYIYTSANPVAYIFQESTNRQRIIHFHPAPSDGTKIMVPYYAYANQVTADGSIIEASPDVHDGIRYGVTARWAELDGDDAARVRWLSSRLEKWSLYSNRAAREDKRSRWATPFTGYPGLTDTPDRQAIDRRIS